MIIARFDIFTAELNEGKKHNQFQGPMRSKKREEFKALLRKNIVTFRFQKRDNTIRKAVGTLYPDYLPEVKGTGRPKPIYQMVYYDMEKNEWRSFRSFKFIKVLKIKPVKEEEEETKPKKKHKPSKGYHVVTKEEQEEREHKKTYKKGDKIPEKELERRSQGYLKHKKKIEDKHKKEKSED